MDYFDSYTVLIGLTPLKEAGQMIKGDELVNIAVRGIYERDTHPLPFVSGFETIDRT